MNEDSPLVCLGMMVADVIGRPLRALPEAGHLVLVDEMSLHTEGCAVKTATALAWTGTLCRRGRQRLGPTPWSLPSPALGRSIGAQRVSRDPDMGTSATTV